MLATLVGLSMLLAVVGGIITLAGCLLGRRLRVHQARRHPAREAARQHIKAAGRLAAEWPLLAQTLGLGYRDQWTRQHRFPSRVCGRQPGRHLECGRYRRGWAG